MILITLSIGKLLDIEAERVIEQLYIRDGNGVIQGLQTLEYKNGSSKAIVLLHGFFESPQAFSEIFKSKQFRKNFDLYIPRLPYHAKDLKTAVKLNNQDIVTRMAQYINELSYEYSQISLVGFSYGGALIVQMIKEGLIPKGINIILYAPAIYISSNTFLGNISLSIYSSWRDYCNYKTIGCGFPVYESGDEQAKGMLEQEISLRYRIIPAIKMLYNLDDGNREYFKHMRYPFSLIVAKNDNRVSYTKLKMACSSNTFCSFYPFSAGKHVIHYGTYKNKFMELILALSNRD